MKINGMPLEKSFIFPGGEIQIQLPRFHIDGRTNRIEVETNINSSDRLMELMLVKDALDHYYSCYYTKLRLSYLPYARQDRRCCEGESFAGKVMVEILDNLQFSEIELFDVHNPHLLQYFIRTKVNHITMLDVLSWKPEILFNVDTVIAPDKGAKDKVKLVADVFHRDFLCAQKNRDPETGKIEDIVFDCDDGILYEKILNKNVIILDDICDGGGTFIGLAKIINEYMPKSLTMYVTHGIFSKGLAPLFEAKIDTIFTTDSFFSWNEIYKKYPNDIQYKNLEKLITLKL